jgi:MYXO-CTERM domain-containing protein
MDSGVVAQNDSGLAQGDAGGAADGSEPADGSLGDGGSNPLNNSGGCGCKTADTQSSGAPALAGLGLLVVAGARRKRRGQAAA